MPCREGVRRSDGHTGSRVPAHVQDLLQQRCSCCYMHFLPEYEQRHVIYWNGGVQYIQGGLLAAIPETAYENTSKKLLKLETQIRMSL